MNYPSPPSEALSPPTTPAPVPTEVPQVEAGRVPSPAGSCCRCRHAARPCASLPASHSSAPCTTCLNRRHPARTQSLTNSCHADSRFTTLDVTAIIVAACLYSDAPISTVAWACACVWACAFAWAFKTNSFRNPPGFLLFLRFLRLKILFWFWFWFWSCVPNTECIS